MTRTLVALSVALTLLVPVASATHGTLNDLGPGRSVAHTLENDHEVVRASGNALDGRVNRVVYPGAGVGDGGLFLDAMLATRITPARLEPGFDFHFGRFASEVTGRSDLIMPSPASSTQASAWFGWWRDVDTDGVIDDVHDGACGATLCPEDEFAWRGLASGEHLGMRIVVIPDSPGGVNAAGNMSSTSNRGTFNDETSREVQDQGWRGASASTGTDGGFLSTVQSFVIAGATASQGSLLGYDLDDPAALIDVDRYEAVSPDLESLWGGLVRDPVRAVWPPTDFLFNAIPGEVDETLALVTGTVFGLDVFEIYDATYPPTHAAVTKFVDENSDPPELKLRNAKEPNHALDDYEGRATFDGVTDLYGAYNDYSGYLDSFHFYFDNEAKTLPCAGAYVAASPVVQGSTLWYNCQSAREEPVGGLQRSEMRTAGAYLTFRSHVSIWKDLNRDTHIGYVCNAESPNQFDADRNTCEDSYHGSQSLGSEAEYPGMCAVAQVRGLTFTVEPLGADWPAAVVARDYKDTTRVAFDAHWEVPQGREPITMRWRDTCERSYWLDARDAILFPQGSNEVPLLVIARADLDGFSDANAGIVVGAEGVTDVDIIPGAF